jgi:hypothetical protein
MKSEERHKLHENALAKSLADVVESVRPYTNAILAVILLVVVVFTVWRWWQRQSESVAATAWDTVYAAVAQNDAGALDKIAEQSHGTEVASWAAVLSGDMHLAAGCQQLFTSKATAGAELRKAVDKYNQVRNESRTPTLRERATFGLARANEALSGTRQSEGELPKAIQYYEEVTKNWPKGTYAGAAQKRLDELKDKDSGAQKFYDRFAQYDPQPAMTPGGPGAKLPFDSKSLPEDGKVPDFSQMLKESEKAADETTKPVKTGPVDLGKGLGDESKAAPAEKKDPAPAAAKDEKSAEPAPAKASEEKPEEKK